MRGNIRFTKGINFIAYAGLIVITATITFLSLRELEYQEDFSVKLGESLKKKEIPVVEKEQVKIGFTTDAHCYASNNRDTNYEWRLNWRCVEPIEAFTQKMNSEFLPDFVVDGGDFVDGKDKRERETFVEVQNIYNKVQAPKYNVLGNHEMNGFSVEEWLDFVDYKKAYYFFDKKGYRFIVLDGNYRPKVDGGIEHTRDGALSYPGLIGGDQLAWLKRVLRSSSELGLTSVVFIHQPPIGIDSRDITKLFYNGREFQKVLSRNNVRAVFSGHIERTCNMQIDGVDYYVLQGFWKGNSRLKEEYRYRNGGVYSEITLNPKDDIKVEMYYRENDRSGKYYSMLIDQTSANCLDGKTLIPAREDFNLDENQEQEEEPALD